MWRVWGSVCACMVCVSVLKVGVEPGPCKGSSTAAGWTVSARCGPPAGCEASLCPPRTPLHCAASCNSVHLCKQLVESGAAIFASTISDIETAADKCEEMEEGYIQCSQFLYGRGMGTGPWAPFLGRAGHRPCRCLGQEKPQVHPRGSPVCVLGTEVTPALGLIPEDLLHPHGQDSMPSCSEQSLPLSARCSLGRGGGQGGQDALGTEWPGARS